MDLHDVRALDWLIPEMTSPYLRIPDQAGHAFHGKLDSHSSANWTLIPRQVGQ